MIQFRRILVPTDFSTCAHSAILHAFYIAGLCGAEIHLLHILEGNGNGRFPDLAALHTAIISEQVTRSSGKNWRDVPVKRVIMGGPEVPQQILTYATDQKIDLIVMGAHGDSGANRFLICGLDYLLVGTTADEIVRSAACPVLTVGLRRGRHPSLIKRILLAVDLSSPDVRSIGYARELAAFYGAELNLLHVLETEEHSNASDSRVASARNGLKQLFDRSEGPDVSVDFHVTMGKVTRDISTFAEQHDMQLIVLSSNRFASTLTNPSEGDERLNQLAAYSVLTTNTAVVINEQGNRNAGGTVRARFPFDSTLNEYAAAP